MSRPSGLGVMLCMLGDNAEYANAWTAAIGKTIASLALVEAPGAAGGVFEDRLVLRFTDGTGVALCDMGRRCCESRYLRTDDDLAYYVGAELRGAQVLDAPDVDLGDGDGAHEVSFLHVETDRGTFTVSAHNEHNGYYDGFSIQCVALEAA